MNFGLTKIEMDKIIGVLHRFPEIEKAFIFGSRASNDYERTSDIDILVKAPNLSLDRFSMLKMELHQLLIIYTIDVVHYERITDKDFKNEIDISKKLFYSKTH